jgi:lysophospholipid acyltransferase (LPLAT)-like uncharacterized protein
MNSDPIPETKPGEPRTGLAYWNRSRPLSRWQRVWIAVVARVGAWMVGWIGRTLRWESRGDEHLEQIYRSGKRAIFTTWHGGIFPATWYWRDRGIVVMTSQNVDGEYIARIIESLGYGAARGSSSRGGMKALVEMSRKLRQGNDVGFTVDGPRGPRFSAKIGPVLLARRTAAAIFCFHVALQRKIELDNWDRSQIPLPFSRALILKAAPIYVSPRADEEEIQRKHREMQDVLDRLRSQAEGHWKKPRR